MKKFIPLFGLLPLFAFIAKKDKPKQFFDAAYFDKTMVYLPGGSFGTLIADTKVGSEHESQYRVTSVSSFHMYPFEVSNLLYRTFVSEIKTKDTALYREVLPDTLVWRDKLVYNEPYVDYYFRHPAYNNYPVVGVSYEQCELFCKWLTEKYAADPKAKHKKINFKLPSRDQWCYSASAEIKQAKKTGISDNYNVRLFPWGGPYLRNSKGLHFANYREIDQSTVMKIDTILKINGKEIAGTWYFGVPGSNRIAGNLNEYADVTAPVDSFWPSAGGMYNLAGNVEEYVREKGITKGGSWNDTGYYLRNDVEEKYDNTNYVTSSRGFRFVMEVEELK
ncbi:MAG: SUMF1/EgtB/PvdO family nonheme iron enzyme [Bacteroidia bacterium]|nr:SUMF1/EgtB/PvdO family nonheme iron enzyme [Bacteroidia bacterium]